MKLIKYWVHTQREYLLIIAAILLFFLSPSVFRMIDPTAGVYDIGVLQNNITAIVSLLIFEVVAWKILCFIWPAIHRYFDKHFVTDFNKLLPWQKISASLALYCFLVFCLVMLSKSISG
ncbi:MAG: hypothetical protein ABI367_14655 [Mucilaginibacter sp.]